jgi:hypothetical protein
MAAGQGRDNRLFTAAFFVCIASCTAALMISGPGGDRLMVTVAAVIGAVAALVPLAGGAINLRMTTWTLWAVSGFAVAVLIWSGQRTRDAGLEPTELPRVRDGSTFSLHITSQVERKYLQILFDVKQLDSAGPSCGDDLRFSVRPDGQDTITDVPPGQPRDIRLGSLPQPGQRQIHVSVRSVIPNALCTVDVSVRGSLHGRT